MLNYFTKLLKEKNLLQANKNEGQIALWHEKLAMLDYRYDIQDFIQIAMDLPLDHKNINIVNRIMDILDVLRRGENIQSTQNSP